MKVTRAGLCAAAGHPVTRAVLFGLLTVSIPFLLNYPVRLVSWILGFASGLGTGAIGWTLDIHLRQRTARRAMEQFDELLGGAATGGTFDLRIAQKDNGARCTHVYDGDCGLSRAQIAAVLRSEAENLEMEEPSPERLN